MATPPMHIYHLMLLHEALTAVHSSYGYGLLLKYSSNNPACLYKNSYTMFILALETGPARL